MSGEAESRAMNAAGRARRESIQFNEGSEEAEQLIAAYRHMMKIGNKAGAQLILGVLKQKYPDAVKQLKAGPQSNPAPNQSQPMSTPNQRESVDPRKLANKLANSKKK